MGTLYLFLFSWYQGRGYRRSDWDDLRNWASSFVGWLVCCVWKLLRFFV